MTFIRDRQVRVALSLGKVYWLLMTIFNDFVQFLIRKCLVTKNTSIAINNLLLYNILFITIIWKVSFAEPSVFLKKHGSHILKNFVHHLDYS